MSVNDTSLAEATSAVSQQLADQYQLYQQLPDGHVQVYKLPAGIVPILVPASSDELKQDSSSLQQLQIPVQAQQLTGVIPSNPSSIPGMNCALINRANTAEKCDGSNVAQPIHSMLPTGSNLKEEIKTSRATECSIKECKGCVAESSIDGVNEVDSYFQNPTSNFGSSETSDTADDTCEEAIEEESDAI